MRVAALVALVGLLVLASPRADACSCRAPGPPCEEMFWGTVFVGKAVSAQPVQNKMVVRTVSEVLNGTILTKVDPAMKRLAITLPK